MSSVAGNNAPSTDRTEDFTLQNHSATTTTNYNIQANLPPRRHRNTPRQPIKKNSHHIPPFQQWKRMDFPFTSMDYWIWWVDTPFPSQREREWVFLVYGKLDVESEGLAGSEAIPFTYLFVALPFFRFNVKVDHDHASGVVRVRLLFVQRFMVLGSARGLIPFVQRFMRGR